MTLFLVVNILGSFIDYFISIDIDILFVFYLYLFYFDLILIGLIVIFKAEEVDLFFPVILLLILFLLTNCEIV